MTLLPVRWGCMVPGLIRYWYGWGNKRTPIEGSKGLQYFLTVRVDAGLVADPTTRLVGWDGDTRNRVLDDSIACSGLCWKLLDVCMYTVDDGLRKWWGSWSRERRDGQQLEPTPITYHQPSKASTENEEVLQSNCSHCRDPIHFQINHHTKSSI